MAALASPWLNDRSKAARKGYYSTARAGVAFVAGTIPGIAYLIYLNRSNEVLREWLRATDTLSPPAWEYALGFGIVGALAVIGFRLIWNCRAPFGRLLLVWALVQAALLYAPVSFQRRFVEGLQLPLSVAASVALVWMARGLLTTRATARYRKLFLAGAIAFASITNVGFVVGQLVVRRAGSGSTDPRRYVHADLIAAFAWLRANSQPDAVLFSSYWTGSLAPSMTGLRVFLGHYAQTLRGDEKGAQVAAFYANAMTSEGARELFAEHRVRYVIYGQFEHEISSAFAPPDWLKLAYRNSNVEVFEVDEAGGSGSP